MKVGCLSLVAVSALGLFHYAQAAESLSPAGQEARYRNAIESRSDKIVAPLALADTNAAARVRSAIVEQYFNLRNIQEVRDAKARASLQGQTDKAAVRAATEKAGEEIRPQVQKLHAEFLAALAKDLTPTQIDQVKDGMTYGVVPLTYGVYLKMYPNLKPGEKDRIMAWLVEARETAMDQGTSEEKHAVFNRYKGKINNFLSQAGYNARQGAENLKKSNSQK